jgi:capsular exopolysaccharide synthesis family protein
MELRQYLALLRRWWWLAVLLTVLGASSAFGIAQLQEPTYRATTTILINQAPGALPDADAVLQGQRIASTYAELLQQRPVLEEVIEALDLTISPTALDHHVSVTPIQDTNLLELTVEDHDPELAADIANEIVEVFISQNVEFQESRYADSLENLQGELDKAEESIDSTEARLQEIDDLGTSLTTEQISERDRLQGLLADYRSSYSVLLDRFEEVRLTQAQTTDKITVVEDALPGAAAGQPGMLYATEGAVIGLILAVGVMLLAEYLNDSVRTLEDVESVTGVATLGAIGNIEAVDPQETLITAFQPRSSDAEAYRVLRANLDTMAAQEDIRSILVTSAGPKEGKTTTAANLAVALAQGGKRVILVDMDLRRPSLHRMFGVNNRSGVTTVLMQEGSARSHVMRTDVENLFLMLSGPIPPNPADLLASPQAADLLRELKANFDVVVIDSPPILAVADPTLIARITDAVLMVVLIGQTKSMPFRRAVAQIKQTGVARMGTVLNRVSSSGDGYYYRYQYYYSTSTEDSTV